MVDHCDMGIIQEVVLLTVFPSIAFKEGAAAGTEEEQVANAAHNYEILHERDDDDAERPDKRQKSGDRHQPTTQQSSHRNHGHNNDHHGSDRQGGECRRAAGTWFKCGQAGHLQKDCKKNTTASTSGQADKKPGASGRVFAINEDHATKTSGTI
nr:hypothetical protein [Tanacetum cinerariifolium]